MSYKEVVKQAREFYPEFSHLDNIEMLIEVESKLVALSRCDDLTTFEQSKLVLKPYIEEFLT